MKTETIDLIQDFTEMISRISVNRKTVDVFTTDNESFFEDISNDDALNIATLNELRSKGKDIMECRAAMHEKSAHEKNMSLVIGHAHESLIAHSKLVNKTKKKQKRLLDYVYPVV